MYPVHFASSSAHNLHGQTVGREEQGLRFYSWDTALYLLATELGDNLGPPRSAAPSPCFVSASRADVSYSAIGQALFTPSHKSEICVLAPDHALASRTLMCSNEAC